jgi:epoxyqueuosine reductase QueG
MVRDTEPRLDDILETIQVDGAAVVRLDASDDERLKEGVARALPGAVSVVVLNLELFQETVEHLTSKVLVGEATLRTLYEENLDIVDGRLNWEAYRLVKHLHDAGYHGIPLPASNSAYDRRFLESVISYRHAAAAAGLGIIGWNGLVLTPKYGPRVRLAAVATDASLTATAVLEMEDPCVKCGGACSRVCPSGAIAMPKDGERYSVDRHRCSTYLTAVGTCAECIRVCPPGRKPLGSVS